MNDIKQMSAEQFRQCQRDGGHCIVDVRNPDEFNAGNRAQMAAHKLHTLIANPIAVVQGGYAALRPAGTKAVMSIERQVRLAAGLTGVAWAC